MDTFSSLLDTVNFFYKTNTCTRGLDDRNGFIKFCVLLLWDDNVTEKG